MKIKINPFKKSKFPIALFIAASFIALGLLPIFFLSLKSMLAKNNNSVKQKYSAPYLLKDEAQEYDSSDPFITKVPQLKDIITKPIVNGDDPAIGNENALVTIVEFSDFECGFCQKQEKILKQILENFGNKVKLIWKDYPESEFSSPSFQAAVAARCASQQNEFWPYHDLLFSKNGDFSKKTFIDLAEKLKLKLDEFKECLINNDAKILIQNNIKEANALNITGVPFIYVNDREIMGEVSYEELKGIIEKELESTD